MTLLISEKWFIHVFGGGGGALHKPSTSIECDSRPFHYYFDIYYLVVWVVAMNTSL